MPYMKTKLYQRYFFMQKLNDKPCAQVISVTIQRYFFWENKLDQIFTQSMSIKIINIVQNLF